MFINANRWKSFTPEQQKIIAEAAQASQRLEYDYEREKDIESMAKLREAGVQIIENVNRAPFEERAKAVWREVPEHASLIEEIRKVR
jgi:TRAP-type C4-dicarboxylate transport system substrate-binding protein